MPVALYLDTLLLLMVVAAAVNDLVSRRIPLAEVPRVLAAPVPFGEVKTIVLPGR